MQWTADITSPRPMRFVIKEDTLQNLATKETSKGYYIYITDSNGKGYDYLQDTLEQAKGFAFRKFQVPLDAWKQMSD